MQGDRKSFLSMLILVMVHVTETENKVRQTVFIRQFNVWDKDFWDMHTCPEKSNEIITAISSIIFGDILV